MSTVKWHEGPIVALDTETTGINPLDARIVTAAIVHTRPGHRPRNIQWLINPDVDIPDEAANVHGWTNQRLTQTLGNTQAIRYTAGLPGRGGNQMPMSREAALAEIAGHTALAMHTEAALVVHNAAYDLTLLETELVRHGIDPLASRPAGIRGVIDPMVIEKQYDPYRKACYKAAGCNTETKHHECGGCRGGKTKCGGCGSTDRTLTSLCAHYGVIHSGAHDAAADALAAVRLAGKLAAAWPEVARWKLGTLHSNQVTWRRQQADGLRAWFDKNGVEHDGVDGGWPVHDGLATVLAGAA